MLGTIKEAFQKILNQIFSMELFEYTKTLNGVSIVFVVLLGIYWFWKRRQGYLLTRYFPSDFTFPFIGSFHLFKQPLYLLQRFGERFDILQTNTFCAWFASSPVLVTQDPNFIQELLSSKDYVEKAKTFYKPLDRALLGGILTTPSQRWRFIRKNLCPVFRHKSLLNFFPILNDVKNNLIHDFGKLCDGNEKFVLPTILDNMFEAAIVTLSGEKPKIKQEEKRKVVNAFVDVVGTMTWHLIFGFLKLEKLLMFHFSYNIKLKRIHDFNKNTAIETFNKKYQSMKEEEVDLKQVSDSEDSDKKPVFFLDQILCLFREGKINWGNVVSETNTIVAASLETTSNALCSTLIFLAMHPEVQMRVFQEISGVFKEKLTPVEYEHFEELSYLEMVIQESLRLAPSIPLIGRQIHKPFVLSDGNIIPKGVEVLISILHLHRRKDIWGQNADKFDPDNFLPGRSDGRHAFAYIPFSKGSRNCVGWRYAQFTLKIMLVGILRNFKLETDDKYEDLELKQNITFSFMRYPKLRIYRRE